MSITTRMAKRVGPALVALCAWSLLSAQSALANVAIKVVSQDPYTNTSSFHKTEVEPDTFSFGNTIVGVHQTGRFSDGGSSNVGYVTSTNGGVSWLGTWTGLTASAVVCGVAVAAGFLEGRLTGVVLAAAFIGSTADSVLGATLESRGLMDNEAVNFSNTLVGSLSGIGILALL